mmetsp:Transcript_36323/g.61608  ORF Transcript_36323/g.61608 Transcript_36323/m.61608 type:complete len:243 (+) Transcript_36323:303-1031(+)
MLAWETMVLLLLLPVPRNVLASVVLSPHFVVAQNLVRGGDFHELLFRFLPVVLRGLVWVVQQRHPAVRLLDLLARRRARHAQLLVVVHFFGLLERGLRFLVAFFRPRILLVGLRGRLEPLHRVLVLLSPEQRLSQRQLRLQLQLVRDSFLVESFLAAVCGVSPLLQLSKRFRDLHRRRTDEEAVRRVCRDGCSPRRDGFLRPPRSTVRIPLSVGFLDFLEQAVRFFHFGMLGVELEGPPPVV